MNRRPLLLPVLLLLLTLAAPALAQPVSREEEERLRALEAERDAIVDLAAEELLTIQPETFHGPLGRTDRPTLDVVTDLLVLDWALALLEHGGAENLDRLRAAAQAARRKQVRDAARSREALADEVRPSSAERFEAGRTSVALREVLARPAEKPADDAPVPADGVPPDGPGPGAPRPGDRPAAGTRGAPLAYIPVSPEELAALRDRHRARGTGSQAWLEQVAADPMAEQRWREASEAERQTNLRRTNTMAVEKEGGYALGEWLFVTFQKKDLLGLSVVAFVLLLFAGAVVLVFKMMRKDD